MFRNCRKNKRKGKAYQHKSKSIWIGIYCFAIINMYRNYRRQALPGENACIQDCYKQGCYSYNTEKWQKDFFAYGFYRCSRAR